MWNKLEAMPGAFLIYYCFPIFIMGLAQVLDNIIKLVAKLIDNTFCKVIGMVTGKDISLENTYNKLQISTF
jgi:hypothetical protein